MTADRLALASRAINNPIVLGQYHAALMRDIEAGIKGFVHIDGLEKQTLAQDSLIMDIFRLPKEQREFPLKALDKAGILPRPEAERLLGEICAIWRSIPKATDKGSTPTALAALLPVEITPSACLEIQRQYEAWDLKVCCSKAEELIQFAKRFPKRYKEHIDVLCEAEKAITPDNCRALYQKAAHMLAGFLNVTEVQL